MSAVTKDISQNIGGMDFNQISEKKKKKDRKQKNQDRNLQEPKDDDILIGPDLLKKPKLEYLDVLLEGLPSAELYERSLMHKENVNLVLASPKVSHIITISVDGHVKLWKKGFRLVDFIKHFRAHTGIITGATFNESHERLITVSPADKTLKIFDILNADLLDMVKLSFQPYTCEFVEFRNIKQNLIFISDSNTGNIAVVDETIEEKEKVIKTITIHQSPVRFMKFVQKFGVIFTLDQTGRLEIWDPNTLDFPKSNALNYKSKLDTDFYELAKNKCTGLGMALSPNQLLIAVYGSDRIIRIWSIPTGKMVFVIDESFKRAQQLQNDPTNPEYSLAHLDQFDFDRRLAVEREIDRQPEQLQQMSMDFDETNTIMIYPTFVGIKFYNLALKQVVRLIGKQENTERFMKLALFQGLAQKNTSTDQQQGLINRKEADPTLFVTAHKKNRFYIFSKRMPEDINDKALHFSNRDIINEKTISNDQQVVNMQSEPKNKALSGTQAVIETTMGEIYINLFAQECPKTVENFVQHAKNGYYDNMIFHRVIQGFMIQTGCPKGDGTGGESIWGGEFQDEFHPNLKHDKPFTVSMANAGPNTNTSQFFITVAQCPWLDNKHTVYGRVYKGMDVVMDVNNVETDDYDKPLVNVKIITIKILQ